MKAAFLTSPQYVSKYPLEIAEVPQPEAKPGNVLLRVRACGVCRTDLHIVEGELPPRRERVIPGHQGKHEIGAGECIFGVAAVHAVTGERRRVAEVFETSLAIPAIPVDAAHPADTHARAKRELRRSSLDDFAHDLSAVRRGLEGSSSMSTPIIVGSKLGAEPACPASP